MRYYHYDEKQYDINQTISKHYDLDKDIIEGYEDITGLDTSEILYMWDENEFKKSKNDNNFHIYEVEPIGEVFNGFTDYSSLICESELDKLIVRGFEKLDIIANYMFAYNGDIKTIKNLESIYNNRDEKEINILLNNLKKETICQKARVIKIIK